MKEVTKQKLLKYLKIILPITLIIYLYELTIGDYISFGSLSVDYLFYYTTKAVFLFNVAAIALYVFLKQRNKIVKIISLIIFYPIAFIFIIYFPLNVWAVVNPHYDKYYLYENNNYKYYLISERFSALDGTEYKYYKEKPVLGFIKIRIEVNEEELAKYNIDIQKQEEIYWNKYIKRKE